MVITRELKPWLHHEIFYKCSVLGKRMKHLVKLRDAIMLEAISRSRQETSVLKNNRECVVDILVRIADEKEGTFSDADLVDQLTTIYLAVSASVFRLPSFVTIVYR